MAKRSAAMLPLEVALLRERGKESSRLIGPKRDSRTSGSLTVANVRTYATEGVLHPEGGMSEEMKGEQRVSSRLRRCVRVALCLALAFLLVAGIRLLLIPTILFPSSLEKLEKGMTMDEIAAILGKPDAVLSEFPAPNMTTWTYTRDPWTYVHIRFWADDEKYMGYDVAD